MEDDHVAQSQQQGKLEALDAHTLRITLPPGMTVTPGQPIPPEMLEMLAGYFSLQKSGSLGGR
jgi:hypothetical protein